jgi:hypothetical protein
VYELLKKAVNGAGVTQSVQRQGYGLDDQSSILGRGTDGIFFSSLLLSYPLGTGGFYLGSKSGLDVKVIIHLHLVPRLGMRGAISPLPEYVFIVWYLNKYRDNFTFT